MNLFQHPKMRAVTYWLILALLVAVLAVTLWQIVQSVELLKQEGAFHHRRQSIQISPQQIRGWMTFRYINLVFHLPQDYLKTSLQITNHHYPNISIDALAKEQKKSSAQMQVLVEQAVEDYFRPVPQPIY